MTNKNIKDIEYERANAYYNIEKIKMFWSEDIGDIDLIDSDKNTHSFKSVIAVDLEAPIKRVFGTDHFFIIFNKASTCEVAGDASEMKVIKCYSDKEVEHTKPEKIREMFEK